jgi:hypothetical protein
MAYDTYTAVGNIPDYSTLLTMLEPDDNPLTSLCGESKFTDKAPKWECDALQSAVKNVQIEGFIYNPSNAPALTEYTNYCQISTKGYKVTGSQEAANTAGVPSNIGHAQDNAMREFKQDMEKALIEQTAAVAGAAGSTGRETGGFQYFMNTYAAAGNTLSNSGTARSWSEDLLNDGLQAGWTAGGKPKTVMTSGKVKRLTSKFSGNSMKTVDAKSKTLYAAIDNYQSDFGPVNIVPNRLMPNTMVFMVDPQYMDIGWYRRIFKDPQPKTGDFQAFNLVGEWGFKIRAASAFGLVKDLTA